MAMSSAASRVSSSLQTKSSALFHFTVLDLTNQGLINGALQTGNSVLYIISSCAHPL